MKRTVLFLLALVVLAPSSRAATYAIDKGHSTVAFKIRHLTSKVQGWFKDFEGTIDFDPAAPEKATVVATIKADSIDTRIEARDKHLKGEDFFDVAKYPEIKFVSSKVTKAGANKFKVDGTLEMHGAKKPATLEVEYSGEEKMGDTVKAGFAASTTVKRTDFDIVWNKTLDSGKLILGDEVTISIDVEAAKGAAKKDEPKKEAPKKGGK
ncbi:MAG: YceI family protein [Elusimicrobia bacterium]|nr:YceI family protein [Elusimicrobiota bacterium]